MNAARPYLRPLPPPPEPRVAVQIAVARQHQPHGRSRLFRIRLDDLDELLRCVIRLERRQ
jgi:hypothetical protein